VLDSRLPAALPNEPPAVSHYYWTTFVELLVTPFQHVALVWGIVPLYVALLINEMTPSRATFRGALQTGFSFLWAGAQWLYPYFMREPSGAPEIDWQEMRPVNLTVTCIVIALGVVVMVSGIRRRYPKYCAFLGHTRFANYFMITIYPIQAHYLLWTWDRLVAISLFALPVWLVLHLGLMPVRGRG
jgi:hypothetical protein